MNITLKRDKSNETPTANRGRILLSYVAYIGKDADIVFANIIQDTNGDVILHGINSKGKRFDAGYVGAKPENVLAKKEEYKKSIIRQFRENGDNVVLKG